MSLDVEFIALVNILLYGLCQAAPHHDIVPFRTLWNLGSILQLITALRSCHTERTNSNALLNIAHFGIIADVTN